MLVAVDVDVFTLKFKISFLKIVSASPTTWTFFPSLSQLASSKLINHEEYLGIGQLDNGTKNRIFRQLYKTFQLH